MSHWDSVSAARGPLALNSNALLAIFVNAHHDIKVALIVTAAGSDSQLTASICYLLLFLVCCCDFRAGTIAVGVTPGVQQVIQSPFTDSVVRVSRYSLCQAMAV